MGLSHLISCPCSSFTGLTMTILLTLLAALSVAPFTAPAFEQGKIDDDDKTLRVFIFAGQSNMVGSDSKVKDVKRFPPFAGLETPQKNVLFSYNIGREEKFTSNSWVALQPVDNVVGPELSLLSTCRILLLPVTAPSSSSASSIA